MSAIARARMDDELKNEAESILNSVGITPSEAIRMLYKQIVNRHAFPLELRVPNQTTLDAFSEVDNDNGELETFTSFDELLNADD
ncbi:MAG: type II toxin-antitoxin system antitoxin, RelB/DinJ family [Piscirickettsiaceae bacterium]|nr:MAG: type II toxin-antitoxin system antitoxin, RelB/DinJ family [Piscirickettsiaceae bacterium]